MNLLNLFKPVSLLALPIISAALLHAQTDQSPFEDLRTGAVVIIAPSGHPLLMQTQRMLQAPEVAEFELKIRIYAPNPASTSKSYIYTAKLVDVSKPAWALFTPSGRLLAGGNAPPTAAQITAALGRAGIKTPLETIKIFLRANPGHTEARRDLIGILKKKAIAQTKKMLDIDVKSLQERSAEQSNGGISWNHTDFPDISSYESKKLDSKEDLEIWGQYATEFDKIFNDGSWRSLIPILCDKIGDVPVELCSPVMVMMYKLHLPKVEEALMALPGQSELWGMWHYFVNIIGKNRGVILADAFPTIPPELRIEWPASAVMDFLVKNARDTGDWRLVRNMLDSFWQRIKDQAANDARLEKQRIEDANNTFRILRIVNWQINYSPLLESMIRLHSDAEAHEFVLAMLTSPELRQLKDKCIEVAIKCERADLAEAWRNLQ